MSESRSAVASGRVALVVTSSAPKAEAWAEALDAAGVGVLVEIQDAQSAQPGGSALVGVLGARPMEFLHVLTVEPGDRERAYATLVDAGWDGHEGLPYRPAPDIKGMAIAAAATLGGIVAFLVIRAALS